MSEFIDDEIAQAAHRVIEMATPAAGTGMPYRSPEPLHRGPQQARHMSRVDIPSSGS